jgi:hypothetical protein
MAGNVGVLKHIAILMGMESIHLTASTCLASRPACSTKYVLLPNPTILYRLVDIANQIRILFNTELRYWMSTILQRVSVSRRSHSAQTACCRETIGISLVREGKEIAWVDRHTAWNIGVVT